MESSTDFERAKNFWQTREARVLSDEGEAVPPMPAPVPVVPKEDPPAAAAATRRYSAPVASLGAAFRRRAKSKQKNSKTGVDEDAATDDDEGEVEEEGEPEPAAQQSGGGSSKTINIKNMKTSMMKTMRSVSVSGRSSNATTASDDHEDEPDRVAMTGEVSREGSPSSAAAQSSRMGLGDVVSWKMKMKLKGKAASARINLSSLATSWKNPSGINSTDGSPAGGAHAAAEPADPTQNIHCPCTRPKTNNTVIPTGSPYGEVVLVDLVAARHLESAQGESDVYVSLKLDAAKRKSHVIEQTLNPVFNERFVFWVPSSPSIELQNVRIIVHSQHADEEHLGEVHLSLAIPMNESFDDWYPLMKLDGAKKAAVRINVRRTVLVSPSLQEAAQKLSAWERSLNNGDYETYGSIIPAVWADVATDSSDPAGKHGSDVIASKLNNLSRRFIGIELTSNTERRDVF